MTEESAVKVCVRVRPLIQREEASNVTENAEPVPLYWKADTQAVHQLDDGNVTKSFSFDRVFSAEESTNQLYQDIAKPLVVSAVEGYNGTIFAYGQTSSGKTFTMMGCSRIPGVIPLAMEDVFQTIKNCPKKEFLLRVSYMEIYNETVTDLLCDSWKRKPLEIREGNYKNVYVADLSEELVTSAEQALSWIRKGEKNRHYGKTKMNQRSSRSHTIFRMILESRERSDPASGENADGAIIVSHLNLVDLAGAERASQTGAEGARLKEGCNINRSLFTLGQVIKKLTDENQGGFTNYRDSKLTRILQNSLGGNAKTVIICTITPATVDETLSTLQFASAAKRMKNDPHVTEVSDDGALLRRYRNEIVDLKRRLQEVSSVTQTTATEKEVLAQLLQEKDQLQREQQDRIRNLTKIIVTSSNFVAVEKKIPKRRVTWGGGKLFRAAQSGNFNIGDAEFEPLVKKRKADMSVLAEQDEDGVEFDSQWEIPEDTQFDIEMNQSNVTMRSIPDSEFSSPGHLNELCNKVAGLELQLHMEMQQKQEAVEASQSLEKRVSELEKQLEVREQESLEDPQEEFKKDLGETIQLCEMLVSEKDILVAERDLIKQEFNIMKDENQILKRDKDHLLKEIEENREMQEFNALEQESTKQYEIELLAEMSKLKKAAEKSVACSQKLEAEMAAMSTQLKQKEELIKELQNLNGRDLVQENQQLRRSLADSETLSRETKKEWAFLRSDNLSLKERDSSMTADYEKMKNEVSAICSKLEMEKSRFKKMQTDLQKELQGAFEENTKLTALLDGKVPKNLIDSIELERTVTGLKKELEMHQEQERFLQTKLEDLEPLKDLPIQVESLKKQICGLTEELCAARAEKDCLLSAQTSSDVEISRLTAEVSQAQDQLAEAQAKLSEAEIREDRLSQQHLDITTQAEELKAELNELASEKTQLLNTVEELNMNAEKSREHSTSIEEKLCEQQLLVKDLEKKLQESSENAEEQHRDQIKQLSEELQLVRSDRDALQSERTNTAHIPEEEQEKLRSHLTSLTEERDQLQEILEGVREERTQLKRDLEEKEEMIMENQEELRAAEDLIRTQQETIQHLETPVAQTESVNAVSSVVCDEVQPNSDDLQNQIKQLTEELQLVRSERDALQSERTNTAHIPEEEQEKLRSHLTSLAEDRDQLQEILDGVREEKCQLKRDLQEKEEMVVQVHEELRRQKNLSSEHQDLSESEQAELQQQIHQLREELENVKEERSQLKIDMQENVEMMIENQEELRAAQEKIQKQKDVVQNLKAQISQMESKLENVDKAEETLPNMEDHPAQIKQLSEELQLVRSERDALQSERTNTAHIPEEEQEKLRSHLTSLTEERDQLQEILEGVREERTQLKRDLEEKEEMSVERQAELLSAQDELKRQQQLNSDLKALISENETQIQQVMVELKRLYHKIKQLSEELQLVRSERDALQSERTNTAHIPEEEQEKLRSRVTSLAEERDQLQEILDGVREEKCQLKRDLQEKEEMSVERQAELLSAQEELKRQQQLNSDLQAQISENETQIKQLTEELQLVRSERDALQSERTNTAHIPEEEQEKLRSHLTSLAEERDQLQEILDGVREEKCQLKRDLQEKEELVVQVHEELRRQKNLSSEHQDLSESEQAELQQQIHQLREELENVKEERSQLKIDMQENVEMMIENQEELRLAQEKIQKLKDLVQDLKTQISQMESKLENVDKADDTLPYLEEDHPDQIKQLSEELQLVRSERDALQSERTNTAHIPEEEQEKLRSHLTSLTEERDQLQEILEGVREERTQLKRDLEEKEEMSVERQAELLSAQEELKQQQQLNSDLQAQISENETQIQQIKQLSEELQLMRSERDALQSERTNTAHIPEEEQEKLRSHLTSLAEERDQLQEILDGVREEKCQLKRDLQEKEEMSVERQAELLSAQEELKRQQQLNSDLQAQIFENETRLEQQVSQVQEELKRQQQLNSEHQAVTEREQAELQQQIQQLVGELEGVREERTKLQSDLQENMEMATETQNLLHSIQEELKRQQQLNADLKMQSSEIEARLEQQIKHLSEELQLVRSERDALQSERTNTAQISEEEQEQLRSNLTSFTEERDQLQEILEGVREEKSRLKRDVQEKEEMVAQVQKQLLEQEHLNSEQQTVREKEQTEFQQQNQQLAEDLEGVRQECRLKAEQEKASQESLSEANAVISSLREQIRGLEERSGPAGQAGERLRCRLEESELQLQKVLEKYQQFGDSAAGTSKSLLQPLTDASLVQNELAFRILESIPKPLTALYVNFRKSTDDIRHVLCRTVRGSACVAKLHRERLEVQASLDTACFVESRLQDLLIRAVQCPKDTLGGDFHQVWDLRLSELLERREQKLQEMNSILAGLEEGVARNAATVSEELPKQERTNEELRALIDAPSLDHAALENLLERERARRTLVLQNMKDTFQKVENEYLKLDLKAFKAQACQQLKEERSKSLTLLHKRESGPAKSEADLLQRIQELTLKLQQSETLVQMVQARAQELEEAQVRAEDRVSKHKEATQLLQTELQDVCAQLKERDDSVQSLREKLRETEAQVKRGMAPTAAELEEMKNKLIKMELERTVHASTHQEELVKMTCMLDHKEEALRKLKEALRKAQQQGDESFMEEPVHAKGPPPTRGRTVQSTVALEKNRLEEEVKLLKKKIAQLESLISSQQLEITKWKMRATKLKENKREAIKEEMPLSPHTPTKRRRPVTSEGHVLDSPKSKFFDARSVSESMSANCPKQFFDNSSLGNAPDLNAPAVEDRNAEWWPMSPTQSENCKTQ
ncbi:centromere-associated protein E-like isoform X2 [Conger conger]|uniref:centromere-associated protein E-like isoform X2 n=1 Tax=Conger conger TaxID=82655 RepID=UPI002A5A9CC4|nr:centromere-associated protein E-like isoform X2 [Conger conger]